MICAETRCGVMCYNVVYLNVVGVVGIVVRGQVYFRVLPVCGVVWCVYAVSCRVVLCCVVVCGVA